ncbi:glycogen debranching enzyme, putative [Syntrophus gentianae]|uniref:Glycogen debranching enzyme, putative n=1 Tax=Syntrophus gentianae TaxID=43775 RepID=A0A1H7WFP4_9BACT|nr:amylo-alpha-1,6-glucosidase [Syntrophus gentianae]SEM20396.1 glycogen debranching enzyme, putative [Syntrophus gentianae]
MMQMKWDQEVPGSRETALELEWLETNGLGAYASSTLLNCHTRKYHGLLVASLDSPPGRHVLLSKVEDSLSAGTEEIFLSCHQYPGVFFPPEFPMKAYIWDDYPRFIYAGGDLQVRKSILLVSGENRVLIRYDVDSCPSKAVLRLRPFVAFRNHHALTKENPALSVETGAVKNGFSMKPYPDLPFLFFQSSIKSSFSPCPVWYRDFEYPVEERRGYEWREDLFCPGVMEIPVKTGSSVIVTAALTPFEGQLKKIWSAEEERRLRLVETCDAQGKQLDREEDRSNLSRLLFAGQQFVIRTPSGRPGIIAGYHWFQDWGRDRLISLPGLTFCSGRSQEGIDILNAMASSEKDGLLPNFFAESGDKHAYNTVDTALWYFWAVQQMLKYTGEIDAIRDKMWPAMKRIISNYMAGTSFNIGMDDRGLLSAGDGWHALTWMDAIVQGRPVTPRNGMPVEINALWYNALSFFAELGERFEEPHLLPEDLLNSLRQAFKETFWIEEKGYLGDVYFEGVLDRTIRPNQILAVSLPFSPLEPRQWKGIVACVRTHLLTPVGIRTLAPEDWNYRGFYEGDQATRDRAYHQGTVWPWLLAHYGEACLRIAGNPVETKRYLLNLVRDFMDRHVSEAGLGCISEVFDGSPPYRPGGCIAQAWSTAGLIQLYLRLHETT